MTPAGLPHSEISGSKRACRSPKLIAACYVLHRLSVPRHPPSTLSNLTIKCLELMRSADKRRISCAFITTTHIQLSTNETRSRRSTLGLPFSDLPTAHLRGSHFLRGTVDNQAAWRTISALRPAKLSGGADRDRTDDPLLAKQVLSQLSYSPGSEEC